MTANIQQCYLGLGSNLTNELGSPIEHIQSAIESLKNHPEIFDVVTSSMYASKPMGPQDQPDFINAVVGLKTSLSPQQLLDTCQQLEQQARRQRLRHWGERSLDVDILLYADKHIDTPTLTIPHAGISERNFVLIPLTEITANINLTIADTKINDIPASSDWTNLKKLN